MLITAEELGRVMPECPASMRAHWAEHLSEVLPAQGINTPRRIRHFIARCAAETGGFVVKRESMMYSAKRILEIFGKNHSAKIGSVEAQKLALQCKVDKGRALANRVYGLGNPRKAKELGNVGADDGWIYRGGGLIQTTGLGAYKQVSRMTGIDFVGHPDKISDPECAVLAAACEWNAMKVSPIADRDDVRAVCKRVNGGYNGLDHQIIYLERAKRVWPDRLLNARLSGESDDADEDGDKIPSEEAIRRLQVQLRDLGYYEVGKPDGQMGTRTRGALLAFKADQGLDLNDDIDADLWEALANAAPRSVSELRAEGEPENSSIVQSSDNVMKVGVVASVTAVAEQASPVLEQLEGFSGIVHQFKSLFGPIMNQIQPYLPYLVIAVLVYMVYNAWQAKQARVRDYQSGKTP